MSTNKGLLDLFDNIIIIRNIFAHPEDKAGKKENKRKWPTNDVYFKQINSCIYNAIMEVVEDVDIFINYKPVFAKNIDDKSKKGTFLLETGEKNKEFELDLTVDDLSNLSTEFRYLLDSKDQVYVQIYYHTIPSVNPSVAPSANPSEAPSVNPSVTPTADPSVVQSANPSIISSSNPSITPSESPSVNPSISPTINPSKSPSLIPTQSEYYSNDVDLNASTSLRLASSTLISW
jgi:hypothetical protein